MTSKTALQVREERGTRWYWGRSWKPQSPACQESGSRCVNAGLPLRLVNGVNTIRAGWRSCTKATGAPCVTTAGTPWMQMSSVDSSALAVLRQHQEEPIFLTGLREHSLGSCALLRIVILPVQLSP